MLGRLSLGIASMALLVIACSSRPPAQPVAYVLPPVCANGPPMCGADRASVVQCQNGQWVMLQSCPGTRGCGVANGMIQCDSMPGAAPPVATGAGEACAAEGGYSCTNDRRALTVCRGGRTVIASTCRGQRGCSIGQAVDCDHSVANPGDPCESAKEIACSSDRRALLRCSGATYQFAESCRNACLSTSGRVLCQ